VQATANRYADLYWQIGEAFEVPLASYAEAARHAEELTETAAQQAADGLQVYNFPGVLMLTNVSDFSRFALRVGDIEGVRRATLLAATIRAAGVESPGM